MHDQAAKLHELVQQKAVSLSFVKANGMHVLLLSQAARAGRCINNVACALLAKEKEQAQGCKGFFILLSGTFLVSDAGRRGTSYVEYDF